MESIKHLYRWGMGPSSSHTMGPHRAAQQFKARYPQAARFRVALYGSLAATGKGHRTDVAILSGLAPAPVELLWYPRETLPLHPNGMRFEALSADGDVVGTWEVYSVGGGALRDAETPAESAHIYPHTTMADILTHCEETGQSLWEYVATCEGNDIWAYLAEVWRYMEAAVTRGLETEGVLPGGLGVARKASIIWRKALLGGAHVQRAGRLAAYALAVAEENAAGGIVVTAPTCGSSGVVPAVLHYLKETLPLNETLILRALATAGLIGNLVKHNGSISGAEVGCQGEIGTACAMGAAAATQLLGGTVRQIEYAAEMGLEHHLGLTCDPVAGLVQIPCIERNVFAASRALTCADYALFSDGTHRIPFDEVVHVMMQTGHDLPSLYRETAHGGLAAAYRKREKKESAAEENENPRIKP